MAESHPPSPLRFPAEKQTRLDQLLDGNADQALSPAESTELESLVAEAEAWAVANARQLAEFARTQSPVPPTGAMPVTIWVAPLPAES